MEQAQQENSKSPIIEALAEIRFDLKIPVSVFLGKIYDDLLALYPDFQQLPINAFPADTAIGDFSFKDAPYYRFTDKNLLVHIGPAVVSINQICSMSPYTGWSDLHSRINQVIEILRDKAAINESKRLSIRYVNFFQAENFKTIVKANAQVAACTLENADSFAVTLATTKNNTRDKVTLTSEAQAVFGEDIRKGQLLDLECSYEGKVQIDKWDEELNDLHDHVKDLFFGTLTEDYVSESNLR